MTRDLVGYGGHWPDVSWPNGARLAVSVVVNVEEGAEQQVLDGDPSSERIGEVVSVVPEGRPDPGQAQIFAYGTRAGAWRMADALRERAMPCTLFACGRAAERAAPVLARLAADGHETASHGWLWRPHADYDDPRDRGRGSRPHRGRDRSRDRPPPGGLLLPGRGEPLDPPAPRRARLSLHVQRLRRRPALSRPPRPGS